MDKPSNYLAVCMYQFISFRYEYDRVFRSCFGAFVLSCCMSIPISTLLLCVILYPLRYYVLMF